MMRLCVTSTTIIGANATATTVAYNRRESTAAPVISDASATGATVSNNTIDDGPWIAYTPVWSCASGGPPSGTVTGRYKQIGKTVALLINTNISAPNGCVGLYLGLPPPTPASSFIVPGRENVVTGHTVIGLRTGANLYLVDYSGPAAVIDTSYAHALSGTYEVN